MPKRSSLLGEKYGRLTVVSDAGNTKYQQSQWECLCECGNTSVVNALKTPIMIE